MADSVAQVRRCADLLRSWGFRVVEVDGWEHRGSGDIRTLGRLEHHTAGSREGDAPSLRTVTFGRPGLRNALCRWYVSRSGVIYLVARRRSWHAGQGTKGSNATLSGTEAENSGTGEPWTPRSLEAQAAISAAECITFGVSSQRVWDHREHAPRRKIDRSGIDSHQWRRRVAALADGGSPELTEEEDVLQRGDRGGEVEQWQHTLNLGLYLTGGGFNGGGATHDRNGSHLKVDGEFGDKTAVATWHLIRRVEIRLNRRSFYADHNRVSAVTQALIAAEIVRMLAADKAGEAV